MNVQRSMEPSIVGLIPARCGSTRIVGKNVKPLGGKPLMVWSIESALESGVFAEVYVASDSLEYGDLALAHGAQFLERPYAPADESDIVWLTRALTILHYPAFAILRPTSPFRTADTIRRAWRCFLDGQPCDSLRAVEPVRQHPGKMWVERQGRLLPLLPFENATSPWHSSATQSLPKVWMQNASLEIAWSRVVLERGTIAGTNVLPFYTEGAEGLDVNSLLDWQEAEHIIARRGNDNRAA